MVSDMVVWLVQRLPEVHGAIKKYYLAKAVVGGRWGETVAMKKLTTGTWY